jgi:Rap1a immunity proteins
MRFLVAMLVAAAQAAPAMAESNVFTAGKLADACESRTDPYDVGLCRGYALAVRESLTQDATICPPSAATMDQFARIVGKFLTNNPEFHHQSPLSSVKVALMKAYLCPATPPMPSAKPSQ